MGGFISTASHGQTFLSPPAKPGVYLLDYYDKLKELVGVESYEQLKRYHSGWVEVCVGDGNNRREEKWTKSIAVGSKAFVERVKTLLGVLARGRKVREAAEAYQLREPSALYGGHFGVKNEGIGPENTYYWNVYDE